MRGWPRTTYASIAAGTTSNNGNGSIPDYGGSLFTPFPPSPEPVTRTEGDLGLSATMDNMDPTKSSTIQDDMAKYGEEASAATEVLIPSYLKRSRYVERLQEQTYRQRKATRETRETRWSGNNTTSLGPRQESSATLNSHMKSPSASSKRVMVNDIIERTPPQALDARLTPLPVRWSETDRCPALDVINNGLEVKYQGAARTPDEAASVRSQYPIPKDCGIYYYEVTVLSKGKEGLIGVGFSTDKPSLNRLPGWESESWGYHGDDGCSFACSAHGKPYGPKFSSQSIVGCGINFRTKSAFFTKDGVMLGEAFQSIKVDRLYPCVGIKKPGEHLSVNFGQSPFYFDIDSLVEKERQKVLSDINAPTAASSLLGPEIDETSTINGLISQYLSHEGFIDTSRQFTAEVEAQKQVLETHETLATTADDLDAVHRQKIRTSILEGNMDRALKYLGVYFPDVLEAPQNRDIHFRLRCRKFVEMMLRSYEAHRSLDGADGAEAADFSMDVDSELHTNGNLDSLDSPQSKDAPSLADTRTSAMVHNDLLAEAIRYGRELQGEYSNDSRVEVKKMLHDTFALIAYSDARESASADMMDGKGRADLAEQVNGAILVSLGKQRSALLEKMFAQSEVLLEMLGEKGGAGALVNFQQDYL